MPFSADITPPLIKQNSDTIQAPSSTESDHPLTKNIAATAVPMLIQDDSSPTSSISETSPSLSITSPTQELLEELDLEQPPPSNATTDSTSHVKDLKNLSSRPTRIRRPPTYLQDYATLTTHGASHVLPLEPNTFKTALHDSRWVDTMKE